jgi:hypothetical protein
MQILLGAGSSRIKRLGGSPQWVDLHTLDFNADHKPDTVHDLNVFPYPFEDNSASEIHAYEVVEHLGQQGDFKSFFAFWSEIWRMLKPDGLFLGTSPMWNCAWAWGDPGHTRIISRECLTFLNQPNYAQVGKTPMTDYRFCYQADFDVVHSFDNNGCYEYGLQAIKPSRINV